MGEMFFRAGGLANINPLMETGLSVFNQALKYLELERCVNYGASIVKYYKLQKDDVIIIFHNIGINPAIIDAAMEAQRRKKESLRYPAAYGNLSPRTVPFVIPPARICSILQRYALMILIPSAMLK